MAGNKAGGIKAAATNKKRYGESFYRVNGSKGGKKSTGGGFEWAAKNLPEDHPNHPSNAGKRGGKVSRRTGVKNGQET